MVAAAVPEQEAPEQEVPEQNITERAAAEIASPGGAEKFSTARKASARYSVFVGAMRFVLPAVALTLVALVIAWPQIHTGKVRFHLNFANMAPTAAKTLSMVKPRFTGVDESERPYTVTAEAATQVASGSPLIDLDQPVADVTTKDGSWVAVRSTEGTYNQTTRDLDLRGNVNLFHDQGYEFNTTRAYVNLHDGVAHGEEPVQGQGPFGQLTSKGFRVAEKGSVVVFTGPAHMTIYPAARKADAQSSKSGGKSDAKKTGKKGGKKSGTHGAASGGER